MKIRIAGKTIGENSPVFIVAEAGINHNGVLKIGKKLVDKASNCGADAIKFQTFKAEDLTSTKSNYFKIFKKLELGNDELAELNDYTKSQGIMFFSTPFSFDAVNLLTRLKVPVFKIASGDLTNIPLIQYVAKKKKPIIISTGMAEIGEVKDAVNSIRNVGNKKIMILHSVSSYPTPPHEANLKAMHQITKKFKFPVGYSDNGNNMAVPVIAVAIGAKIIEKHFTIDKKLPGPDHKASANPQQFKELIKNIRFVEELFGDGVKRCQKSEIQNKINARRNITTNITIEKGTKILDYMIGIKRPAIGIEPKFFKKILGKTTLRKIKVNNTVNWKDIR